MHPNASHLSRSRHGIWYFRWRVPADIRKHHPELPKELKRSTKTADTRRARALAREMYCGFLLRFAIGQDMSSPFDSFRFSGFTLKRDPVTARITEVSTDDKDTPSSLALLERLLELDATHASVTPPLVHSAEARPTAETGPKSCTIGEAIDRYSKLQIQTKAWSDNTSKHTHLPSLRLFKELVGHATATLDGIATPSIDLPLGQLSRPRLETFIDEFWRFPDQQGMRNAGRSAREILEAGGSPQSQANVYKRLAHIRQFLAYCCDKDYVDRALLREIDLVLAKDTARSRERAAVEAAGEDGIVADGYVAFTPQDLCALFGEPFLQHARSNAARYWVPLLSLCTGLRVGEASQLRPVDFEVIEGVACVRVKGEVGQPPDRNTQRLKTLASRRAIPLHPQLLELGLMTYVEDRIENGEPWMWDDLLWTEKSGFGKYPSRDFQTLAERVGVYQKRRKVFHSFRSTISQKLEAHGLDGDLLDRFLGHEPKTTRGRNYGRTEEGLAFPIRRVHELLSSISLDLNVPPWLALR